MYLVFDFDHTLAVEGVVYPGLGDILKELVERGHHRYLCSYNPMAERLLTEQELFYLFTDVLHIPDLDKGLSIRNYCWEKGLDLHQVLFFDDDRNSISCARMQGIKTCYVGHSGLTAQMIREVLPI